MRRKCLVALLLALGVVGVAEALPQFFFSSTGSSDEHLYQHGSIQLLNPSEEIANYTFSVKNEGGNATVQSVSVYFLTQGGFVAYGQGPLDDPSAPATPYTLYSGATPPTRAASSRATA